MTGSRPTHAEQQKVVDEALAALPAARFRWLFTPDPKWMAAVNTTTYREVNAVRMFVAVTLLFVISYLSVVGFALTRCGIELRLFGLKVFQMTPPPGKLNMSNWLLCEESNAGARLLDFASGEFVTYSILLAAMAAVALGAMGVKRVTDTEHVVRREQAKKAPIIMPVTSEHAAMAPVQQTVNVEAPNGDVRPGE